MRNGGDSLDRMASSSEAKLSSIGVRRAVMRLSAQINFSASGVRDVPLPLVFCNNGAENSSSKSRNIPHAWR